MARLDTFFDPTTWCNPERERRELVDISVQPQFDINEVLYALNAFWATLKPVAISLVLSSLAVIYIQSEATRQDKQSGLKVYDISDDDTATDDEERDSNSVKFGKSLINAIVIICVIALFTFVLVFCYWMRCMKFLLGYMIFSSGLLLSLLGGIIWYIALSKWELPCDMYTFFIVLYNFAIVGVLAIFYQKGIPTIVTQAYLVCTSVILAWNLTRFDEWTCWALLLMLALYDLCAVLTPCGPLKLLVGLMQERNDPLPGLLYEANLPHPPQQASGPYRPPLPPATPVNQQGSVQIPAPMSLGVGIGMGSLALAGITMTKGSLDESIGAGPSAAVSDGTNSEGGGDMESSGHGLLSTGAVASSGGTTQGSDTSCRTEGQLDRRERQRERERLMEASRFAEEDGVDKEHSIKLGLGDFVFYSVLVSRAATHGFATFAACALVILGGLGMTLVLLSVFRKALPALPISIFLGILFYLCTRFVIVPWIEEAAGGPIYM